MPLILAVLGAVLVAVGVALSFTVPIGLIVAGGELLAAAYVARYLENAEAT